MGARFQDFLVGADGLSKRKFLANYWPNRAVFEARVKARVDIRLIGFGNAPEDEAAHR